MFSTIGYIHLFFSILAMITGLVVVLNTKGTLFHKRVGYIYVIIMMLLNLTSFFISNFQGIVV